MSKKILYNNQDFEHILTLIRDARNRVYSKANSELVAARNTSPAVIADYETKLIDKKTLSDKLHQLAEVLNKNIE